MFNKSVSWVRVRDDHILTVDRVTFIADERFHAYYATTSMATGQQSSGGGGGGPWTLQIKYVQARDEGIYECQVSSEPKVSARIHLHVVGEYIFYICIVRLYAVRANSTTHITRFVCATLFSRTRARSRASKIEFVLCCIFVLCGRKSIVCV